MRRVQLPQLQIQVAPACRSTPHVMPSRMDKPLTATCESSGKTAGSQCDVSRRWMPGIDRSSDVRACSSFIVPPPASKSARGAEISRIPEQPRSKFFNLKRQRTGRRRLSAGAKSASEKVVKALYGEISRHAFPCQRSQRHMQLRLGG